MPKPRARKAKTPEAESPEPPPRRRKAKTPELEALEASEPPRRARKVRVEIPQPEAPALGPDFWAKMLDAHREQQESSRRDHYASFRIA